MVNLCPNTERIQDALCREMTFPFPRIDGALVGDLRQERGHSATEAA